MKSESFESVNDIGMFSVSWTLGAALLHASSTIPSSGMTFLPKSLYPQMQSLSVYKYRWQVIFIIVFLMVLVYFYRRRAASLFSVHRKRSEVSVDGDLSGQRADLEMESLTSVVVETDAFQSSQRNKRGNSRSEQVLMSRSPSSAPKTVELARTSSYRSFESIAK